MSEVIPLRSGVAAGRQVRDRASPAVIFELRGFRHHDRAAPVQPDRDHALVHQRAIEDRPPVGQDPLAVVHHAAEDPRLRRPAGGQRASDRAFQRGGDHVGAAGRADQRQLRRALAGARRVVDWRLRRIQTSRVGHQKADAANADRGQRFQLQRQRLAGRSLEPLIAGVAVDRESCVSHRLQRAQEVNIGARPAVVFELRGFRCDDATPSVEAQDDHALVDQGRIQHGAPVGQDL